MPKIVIAGGSGLLGRATTHYFLELGWEVVICSRHSQSGTSNQNKFRHVVWLPESQDTEQFSGELSNTDVIINFSGASIAQRWTNKTKKEIVSSRVVSSNLIGHSILQAGIAESIVCINMSGIGYYGDVNEVEITEEAPNGSGFLAHVCNSWEKSATQFKDEIRNLVLMRTGMVLSSFGGVFLRLNSSAKILPLSFGDGNNYMPFIHVDDFVRIIELASNKGILGPVNVCTDQPITSRELALQFAEKYNRKIVANIPEWALKIAESMVQFPSEMVLFGQRAIPSKLIQSGFQFNFSTMKSCIDHLSIQLKEH